MFNFATSISYIYMVSATSKIVICGQHWEFSPCFYSCIPPHTHEKDIKFLSDKSQKIVKFVAWTFLSWYMICQNWCKDFFLVVTLISQCWYLDFSRLLHGFVKVATCLVPLTMLQSFVHLDLSSYSGVSSYNLRLRH